LRIWFHQHEFLLLVVPAALAVIRSSSTGRQLLRTIRVRLRRRVRCVVSSDALPLVNDIGDSNVLHDQHVFLLLATTTAATTTSRRG
jgi:hypothetical protein